MTPDKLKKIVSDLRSDVEYWNIRFVERKDEVLSVRQGVAVPPQYGRDLGVMVTVFDKGGQGYGASSDLSKAGLQEVFATAKKWAQVSARQSVTSFDPAMLTVAQGRYESPVKNPWFDVSLGEKFEKLQGASTCMKSDSRIVDCEASFWAFHWQNYFLSSMGAENYQVYESIMPNLSVTAFDRGETIVRTFGGLGICRQGGFEVLEQVGFEAGAASIVEEAIQLLTAPNCPSGEMDVLLEPDQMILQIHESIGHPLELDRILGDERNYAGTSFVTPDMFGQYQYGSELLNITFDPTVAGELASYAFDDEGTAAEKVYLIKDGKLLAGLGGKISQHRSGLPGVANARSVGWNRPPIDRMANLNLEPGSSSLQEMIRSIERGILMKTNCSWSIDDSRNKFQFGCELGQLIENGELKGLVKKPNYRGISADFWRNLAMVGDAATMRVLGTPYCGKGEPNQAIMVGHASPACVFKNVQVFGGE